MCSDQGGVGTDKDPVLWGDGGHPTAAVTDVVVVVHLLTGTPLLHVTADSSASTVTLVTDLLLTSGKGSVWKERRRKRIRNGFLPKKI